MMSLRAFDAEAMLINALVIDGAEVETGIESLLSNPSCAYVHIHFAKPGCYAARVYRC